MSDLQRSAELEEARLFIMLCCQDLTPTEHQAIIGLMVDEKQSETTSALDSNLSRGAIWMARQSALEKMRKQLRAMKIRSTNDLISPA